MKLRQRLEQFGKRVVSVRLKKRHLAFGIGIAAKKMGNLLENQDHADSRKQSTNHARGHE